MDQTDYLSDHWQMHHLEVLFEGFGLEMNHLDNEHEQYVILHKLGNQIQALLPEEL